MAAIDPHSFADDAQPRTRHLSLDLAVDFEARAVRGQVTLAFDRAAGGRLDLDTRDLSIEAVSDAAGPAPFTLDGPDPIRGARLSITTKSDRITIRFSTSPKASALQWLEPAQTAGKRRPYMFTQCQAIHARSVMPCQDTPRVRSTYDCRLSVPPDLRAVMAAAFESREAGAFRFRMPQPIPSYLFAFAVGDIADRDIGPRSKVFAEPAILDAAAWEFEGIDRVLTTAEGLFGPYPWDRFDLLVMPPSFPYGGMENPRLTFLTPTLLAKDRSLVNVVAHELAHSWTGNLVTNADMNHFWLNEGFTVYAERRILEAIEGLEAKALQAAIGRIHLEEDLARLSKKDIRLTRLENDLTGVDPDEVYSGVPYEKGYLFLVDLEQRIGRPRFDRLLGAYIDRFRFQSITTADFLRFLEGEIPAVVEDAKRWIHGTGLPADAPSARSASLDRVLDLVARWGTGDRPDLAGLSSTEWQLFLGKLEKKQSLEDCRWLDETFHLTASSNCEIRVGWLTIAAASGYAPAYGAIRATLTEIGRMKYLRPLYTALIDQGPAGQALAREIFTAAKDGYHPVARGVVEGLLKVGSISGEHS
jgi:leukotriene A-4 hydrolase/aminopeptidase